MTELAQASSSYADSIYFPWENVEPSNFQGGSLEDNMMQIVGQFGTYDGFVDVVRENVSLRSSVTPEKS